MGNDRRDLFSEPQTSDPDFEQRLLADLECIARPRHARWDEFGLLSVRSMLQVRLRELGPVEEHHFAEGRDAGVNLIVRLPGQRTDLDPILVAAHYDGPLGSPGADDNASAVAALLELGRRWVARPPVRPVWLVAFDQEEWGMVGSGVLARELREQQQQLRLVVSLEMLGYTSERQHYPLDTMRAIYRDRGDFIALVGNLGASSLLLSLAESMNRHVTTKVLPVPFKGHLLPDVRLSDHSPFWDAGYNALTVTETSFLRNPNYHKPTDTVDILDLPFLMAVIDGLEVAIGELG
mgnify:CR=1 FL=1